MPKRRTSRKSPSSSFGTFMRRPAVQIGTLLLVAAVIVLILALGNAGGSGLPAEISVDQAYSMYQNGAFVLDVRTVEEWNDFHVPGTTLIPLDQLASRVNEVPRDRQIIVICRSGNRSTEGRDILLEAGFTEVTCMKGGLTEWRARGYPIEP